MKLAGITDEGLHYRVLRTPDEAPPIVLAVAAPRGKHWTAEASTNMIGQTLGMKWGDRTLLLRIVSAQLNPMTRQLEITCR